MTTDHFAQLRRGASSLSAGGLRPAFFNTLRPERVISKEEAIFRLIISGRLSMAV